MEIRIRKSHSEDDVIILELRFKRTEFKRGGWTNALFSAMDGKDD